MRTEAPGRDGVAATVASARTRRLRRSKLNSSIVTGAVTSGATTSAGGAPSWTIDSAPASMPCRSSSARRSAASISAASMRRAARVTSTCAGPASVEREPEPFRGLADAARLDRAALAECRGCGTAAPRRQRPTLLRPNPPSVSTSRVDRHVAAKAQPVGREGRAQHDAERSRREQDADHDHRSQPAGAHRTERRHRDFEGHRAFPQPRNIWVVDESIWSAAVTTLEFIS